MAPGAATNGRPTATRTSELVRFATAGSVDDGKSTLIGRLLYDTKSIFEDQLEHVEETSRRRGDGYVNLALLTDGLRAEREQGITIDVAYRYFHTPRRKFIIADTPGHEQYTRNMVTGASTADLALILIDARKGVLEQSHRHAFIASLLRIPHLVVCVNKMDLVDWDQEVFDRICSEFTGWAAKLDVQDVTFIPISALHGDNVVERSERMAWYQGPALLYHLEHVHVASDRNLQDARFPVQWVTRPMSDELHDYRGYAGEVASGVFRMGDEVVVLPSGRTSRIAGIDTYDAKLDEAYPPLSVTLRLEDPIDVSRGDMICRPTNRPKEARDIDAMVCWMSERPLSASSRYRIKHTSRTALAKVDEMIYRIDVNSLHRNKDATRLELNEIGKLRLRLSAPLLVDEYRRNRATGSFILIDESTNDTVGAGMVL
jgi:bifunctional enzyme CysN/CysC